MTMDRSPKRWLLAAISIGVAVGISFPVVALSSSAPSHTVCVRGALEGWSGTLLMVDEIYVAPPGGWVQSSNWAESTYWVNGSRVSSGGGGFGIGNDTYSDMGVQNWSMYAQSSRTVSGAGSVGACLPYTLVDSPLGNATDVPFGGCGGCEIAPAVPGTIGTRTNLPTNFTFDGLPTSTYDAYYSAQPLGTLTWSTSDSGNPSWSLSSSLIALGLIPEAYYNPTWGLEGVGLTFSIPLGGMAYGIPIHLLNGTVETVDASVSDLYPGVTFTDSVTYIFPTATEQGDWEVFGAGSGSPISIGGFLFQRASDIPAPP
jgi:hypothetical protein